MQKETRYLECFMPDLVSTIDPVCNRHNNQYVEDHIRYISLTKHVAAVMFLGLVCSNGKALPPVLFDSDYRLIADGYINIMTLTIILWMGKVAGKKNLFSSRTGPPHSQQRCMPSSKKN